MHLFAVAIDRDMKSKLFKETLIMEAYKIGRSLGIPLITFIASSRNDQERLKRIGWKVYESYTEKSVILLAFNYTGC